MKKVLITGGDGFIGRNLISELLKNNNDIINIDNNITSYPQQIKSTNYKKFNLNVSEIDINKIEKIDIIVHLASVASPQIYKQNANLVLNPNVFGTKVLLKLAKRDCAKFFFASTSEVYGHLSEKMVTNSKIREEDDAYISLLTERSCYSAAKRLGEELTHIFVKNGGIGTNLRLFNVFGRNMDLKDIYHGRVIPNFFNKIWNDGKIQIFGNGKQIRSFLWVSDLINAIIKIIHYEGNLPCAINLGNDEPISILDLSYKISSKLNKDYKIDYLDREKDDPLWRRPDTNLVQSLINWSPKTSLDEGLKLIAKDYLSTNV